MGGCSACGAVLLRIHAFRSLDIPVSECATYDFELSKPLEVDALRLQFRVGMTYRKFLAPQNCRAALVDDDDHLLIAVTASENML